MDNYHILTLKSASDFSFTDRSYISSHAIIWFVLSPQTLLMILFHHVFFLCFSNFPPFSILWAAKLIGKARQQWWEISACKGWSNSECRLFSLRMAEHNSILNTPHGKLIPARNDSRAHTGGKTTKKI